jgi:hypothetical protein
MGNEEALREEIERQSREIDWLRSALSRIAGAEIWPNDIVNRHTLMTAKEIAAGALEERSWFERSSQDAASTESLATPITLKVRTEAEMVRDNAKALFNIALSDCHTPAETLRHIAQEALGLPKL